MPTHQKPIHIMDPSATRPTPDAAYYTTHPFVIFNPDHGLTWLSRIGPENTSSLHTLRIMIHAVYNPGPNPTSTGTPPSGPVWIALFNYLSYYATGLKEVKVHWDSDAEHYGGGADGEVVRALAGIGGLERLELGGFYLETWPGYLEENTGAKVVEEKERGKAAYWVELARWRRHFEVGVS